MEQVRRLSFLDPLAADSIEECFQRSEVFNFAQAVQAHAIGPSRLYTVSKRLTVGVSGKFSVPDGNAELGDVADCSVEISRAWRICPPRVQCHEAWYRNGDIDWHSYRTGGVCYEFPMFWQEQLQKFEAENGPAPTLQLAVDWCLTGVRSVLAKHLLGDRLGLKQWPTKWGAWPHGFKEARRVHESERAQHR